MGHDSLGPSVISAARAAGASLVGLCELPPQAVTRHELKYACSFAIELSHTVVDELTSGPTPLYAHHYTVVNSALDRIALVISRLLQSAGHAALPVPASQYEHEAELLGLIPHKTPACLAGLGTIGMSALLISPQFGPRLRLATVVTDCPFDPTPQLTEPACRECGQCVTACPAKAILGTGYRPGIRRADLIDADRCRRHIRTHGEITGAQVCGVCIAVCPVGRALPATH